MKRLAIVVLIGCGAATPQAEEPDDGSPGPEIAVSLRLVDASEADVPASDAQLVLIHRSGRRELTPLTSLQGVCTHAVPEAGEVLRVSCWWAGAGSLLVARREGDVLIVARRVVDEENGPGEAEEIGRVELPRRAQLSPVTP